MNKAEWYKWAKLDPPGRFAWVPIKDLQIDPEYQRETNDAKILRIAGDFTWKACCCLGVADRGVEGLFVYDGQHRLEAARRRGDIEALPCWIVRPGELKSEAQAYLDVNRNRKALTTVDQFAAMKKAGHHDALAAQSLLDGAGVRITTTGSDLPLTIKCLGTLLHQIKTDREALFAVWPMVARMSHQHQIRERVLDGLCELYRRNASHGVLITDEPWLSRIIDRGMIILNDAAGRASAYHAKGGSAIWAKGIAKELNHKTRSRLPWPTDNDS